LLLLGAGYFTVTLGVFSWSDQERLWPFYLIMLGIGLLAGYVASGFQRNGYLFTGLTLPLLGGALLPLTISRLLYDWAPFLALNKWFNEDWEETWWPIFPIATGAVLLVVAALATTARARSNLLFFGLVPLLLGGFFLITTLGLISWEDQGRLWPVYPLVVGVGSLAAHFAMGEKERFNLVSGLVLCGVGLFFLPITLLNETLMAQLWPLLIIVVGIGFMVPWLRGGTGHSLRPR
jgi:hypothetical protein